MEIDIEEDRDMMQKNKRNVPFPSIKSHTIGIMIPHKSMKTMKQQLQTCI